MAGAVDVFGMREHIVDEYKSFTTSFVEPSDARIARYLAAQLDSERQWPDPRPKPVSGRLRGRPSGPLVRQSHM